MADNIGSLAVSLALDASSFTADLDRSAKKFQAFGKDASNFEVSLGGNKMADPSNGGGKFNDLLKEGANVARSVATPTENYNRKMAELNGLLSKGAIGQETFNRAAKQAKADLGEASNGLGGLKIASEGAAVAVAAVTAGLGLIAATGVAAFAWAKSGIDSLSNLGREATKLGISVEKLSDLQYAAGRSGDGLVTGLEHLERKMGEAARGSAEAKDAFQRWGLNIKDLQSGGIDGTLDKFADRMMKLGSATDRALMAEELMGRGIADMIPVWSKGAAGLEEMGKRARQLGVEFSAADVGKVQAAQRAMDDIGKIAEGVRDTLAVEISPYITALSTATADWLSKFKMKDLIHDGFGWIKSEIPAAIDGMAELAKMFDHAIHKIEALGEKAAATFEAIGDTAKLGSLSETMKGIDLDVKLKDLGDSAAIKKWTKDAKGAIADSLDGAQKKADEFAKSIEDAAKPAVGPTLSQLNGMADQAMQLPANGLNIFAQTANKLHAIKDALGDSADATIAYTRAEAKLNEELLKSSKAMAVTALNDSASSFDKLSAKIEALKLAGVTGDALNISVAHEFAQLDRNKSFDEIHNSGIAEQGSQAAYDTILNYENQGKAGDVQSQMLALLEESKRQQAELISLGQRQLDAWSRIYKKGN